MIHRYICRMRHRLVTILAALLVSAVIAAGCSSSDDESANGSTNSSAAASSAPATPAPTTDGESAAGSTAATVEDIVPTTTVAVKPVTTCSAPDTTTPLAVADLGNQQDYDVTSFDGTIIRTHWFPAPPLGESTTAPTVLMGPGWGSAGDTNVDSAGQLGAINIGSLRAAGYNVLTWDPRGFGESTGVVTIDSVEYEGRDVQQLIDWVATLPEASLDGQGDPLMGMVGGSYGGGIQLVTAAVDCRIDAIVPVIAWNSLTTSLYKNETPKSGWTSLLITATFGAPLDPTITRAQDAGNSTGTIDPADVDWLADRGPGESVANIAVPTLLIQGTVDTLFTLDEAIANYRLLQEADVPLAMLWFCGGHGICLTDEGDPARVGTAAIAWLDRYVKDDTSVDTGPAFEFVDQDGTTYTAAQFDTGTGDPVLGSGSGTLDLVGEGGAGPAAVGDDAGLLGTFAAQITPGLATNSVDVTIEAGDSDSVIVGAPQVTLSYTGSNGDGDRPQRVFAQFVDDTTGLVIGNQITPIDVVLDGQPQTMTVPLEAIAFTMYAESTITLQLVATTVAYAQPQLGGSVTFDRIDVTLPVTADLSPAG